jgi:hypothetical protein
VALQTTQKPLTASSSSVSSNMLNNCKEMGWEDVVPKQDPLPVHDDRFLPYDQTSELGGPSYSQTLEIARDQHPLLVGSDTFRPYPARAFQEPSRQLMRAEHVPCHGPQSARLVSNMGNPGPGTGWEEEWMSLATADNVASHHSMLPSAITFSPYSEQQALPANSQHHAYADPWSLYQTASTDKTLGYPFGSQGVGQQEPSDTTPSTDETYGTYDMVGNSTPSRSSWAFSDSGMVDSTLTERPCYPKPEHFPQEQIPTHQQEFPYNSRYDPFRCNVRSASPQVGYNDRPPSQHKHSHLSLPIVRKVSSASSCASEASSLKPDTPEVLYCDELDCVTPFNGKYRKGNLARHKRLIHRRCEPYVCESDGCERSFKRQDARLKHHRRHHPLLAAPYVPRGSPARRPDGNQDDDLRNISSWTENASGSVTGEMFFNAP